VCCACLSVRYLFLPMRPPPRSTLFPYTTLFRSHVYPTSMWDLYGRSRGNMRLLPNRRDDGFPLSLLRRPGCWRGLHALQALRTRSEEHTSEVQSRGHLVCRLLLEKKKTPTHSDA